MQVVPSQNGRQVDMDAVATAILAGERRIDAPIAEVIPERDTAWAEGLGIKEEVSTFTTRHASGEARVTNIHVAADLLNNTIVEPGATFSLNDTIGPRTVDRGFVLAPVFYGEFTEDIGGGVSQLATTTFNAVFWGGYEDVFHKPHTIYISRYPMGREATVNYGTVDLQFRNDSNAGVLIRTSYSSNSITVTFYGDKEGKVVTEEGRKVLAERPVEQQPFECPGPPGLDKNNVCAGAAAGPAEACRGGPRRARRGVLPSDHPARTRAGPRTLLLALPHDAEQVPRGHGPAHHDDAGAPAHGNHRGTAGGDDGSAAGRNAGGSAGHRGCSRALAVLGRAGRNPHSLNRARRGAD